jgi:hypothetical protein
MFTGYLITHCIIILIVLQVNFIYSTIYAIDIRKIAGIQEDNSYAFMMAVVYNCTYKCLL